jgi:hypothetical protein
MQLWFIAPILLLLIIVPLICGIENGDVQRVFYLLRIRKFLDPIPNYITYKGSTLAYTSNTPIYTDSTYTYTDKTR